MRLSRSSFMVSPEAEEGQDDQDDNNEADNVDYAVHLYAPLIDGRKQAACGSSNLERTDYFRTSENKLFRSGTLLG